MQSLVLYAQLVADVDRFLDGAYRVIGAGMVCGPGCDACCQNALSLLPVEAYRLREGFEGLAPNVRQRVGELCRTIEQDGLPGPCPLLHEAKCLLYEFRPLVCRTHGFPLFSAEFAEEIGRPVDFCHLNFTEESGLETIPREAILNLDLLSRKLFVINRQFLAETGRADVAPDTRIDMTELFAEVVNDSVWRKRHNGEK
ncbi:MAG: YkgJ family cysteine cluster protein [Nitrospirota bacterium]|nr:YkgJ family cysteine cluster protein [Nitrospirota bacterium]